jgi:hypothetical protein
MAMQAKKHVVEKRQNTYQDNLIKYVMSDLDVRMFDEWMNADNWTHLDCLSALVECQVKLSITPGRSNTLWFSATWKGQAAYLEGMTLSVGNRDLQTGLHVIAWVVTLFQTLTGDDIENFLEFGVSGLHSNGANNTVAEEDELPF